MNWISCREALRLLAVAGCGEREAMSLLRKAALSGELWAIGSYTYASDPAELANEPRIAERTLLPTGLWADVPVPEQGRFAQVRGDDYEGMADWDGGNFKIFAEGGEVPIASPMGRLLGAVDVRLRQYDGYLEKAEKVRFDEAVVKDLALEVQRATDGDLPTRADRRRAAGDAEIKARLRQLWDGGYGGWTAAYAVVRDEFVAPRQVIRHLWEKEGLPISESGGRPTKSSR